MTAGSVLRRLAGEVVDFVVFVGELLGGANSGQAREAILRDLGAKPGEAGALVLPEAQLASIKAYRESVDDDLQADIQAAGDIALLIGAIIDQVEAWGGTDWSGRTDTLVTSLFDLLGRTYVRQRWPKLYLVLQAVAISYELTGSLGPGEHSLPDKAGDDYRGGRFFNAIVTILAFVWNPGRTLDDLDDTREGASGGSVNTDRDRTFFVVDGLIRGIVAAIAVIDQYSDEFDENLLSDVIVGWDAAGLDVDSDVRPTAADLLASRMVSLALRRQGTPDVEELKVSWLYLPRRIGAPSRPHQLFLALGGALSIDEVLNPNRDQGDPEWRFRVGVKSDAGAALLISGDDVQASPEASGLAATFGYVAIPDESGVSYALPRSTGIRVELGEMSFLLTLGAQGARVLAVFDHCALVVDGSSADSFIRKLLDGKPYRTSFGFSIGYDSNLGFIHEVHRISGQDSTSGTPVPFDSSGPAGPSDLDLTLPLGGGNLLGSGINLLEVVVRLAWRSAEEPESGWAVAAGGLITFSATWGPVYLRVDELGLRAELGTTKLQKDRNLGLVDAHVAAALPTGIALSIDTKAISGGGAIHHDLATGDYYGAVVLRVGKRITLTCLGLVSTRDAQGNPLTSFILIGTIDHLGLTAGFITLDGLGVLYAADRTMDVPAVRAALPSGKLKHLLFPADPLKNLPEMVSGLRTFFPPKQGSHIYGLLVKLTFGSSHPLLTAELALMLERDGSTDSSRLLVLGRVFTVLPQADAPLLTLNLDVVGEFDLDTGVSALDAVLYESKLFGRFVLTGAAAFRRAPGMGFALAIGGFNPRFTPPANFPAVPRITVALTTGDNPKLIIEAYLAITPNTLQFGATASLYAAAYGFSIEGYVGFDVLVQFWPPHFIADFKAGVQLKRGSRNLFKVDVRGTLEGPLPLRVAGKATFGILWWDYTVGFDKTLIGGSNAVVSEALDVLGELLTRLGDPLNWRTVLPAGASQLVGVRTDPAAAGLRLHPLGRLVVQQGLVPLNLDRDIDRVGAFVPAADRRFRITEGRVGTTTITEFDRVHDEFPDSQFFTQTDAERLTSPGMVVREAGVGFGNDGYATDASLAESAPFAYTEIIVGDDGVPVEQDDEEPTEPSREHVLVALRMSAAARALTRTSIVERYASTERPDAPRLVGAGRLP